MVQRMLGPISLESGISILWIPWCECETTSNQELGLGDLYVMELFEVVQMFLIVCVEW